MQRALVQDVGLGAAGLHHHAPAHRVERIRDDTGDGGHGLRDRPADHQGCVLGVGQHAARGVVESEVGGAVDDDTLDRHSETSVQAGETVGLVDLGEAVSEAAELARAVFFAAFADVGGETGTREVERVHEAEGSGSGGATGSEVTGEVAPELGPLIYSTEEHLLVLVLEGEVERLRGEVPDDVGEVTAPEGEEALLLRNADEGVDDALVTLVGGDLFAHMLHLEQQLDTLDRRDGGLGDGGGHASGDEVFRERDRIGEVRHFVRLGGSSLGNRRAARYLKDHTRNGYNHETRTPDNLSGDLEIFRDYGSTGVGVCLF